LIKTLAYTTLALIAFAGNSVLCRMALGEQTIDAASFTHIRLLSGAVVLFLILKSKPGKTNNSSTGSWFAAITLFVYALSFSYAYITLDTATGALILFGVVQITMVVYTVTKGKRLHLSEWIGVSFALCGFIYLVLPGLTTPSLSGFLLMTLSGIAWGMYTLIGRGSTHPLEETTFNFVRTIPLIILLGVFTITNAQLSNQGIILAILSGAIASGIGYTIWYMALPALSATQAGVVQLLVPVFAAIGGIFFVGEQLSLRLLLAGSMILGGILVVIIGKQYFLQHRH